MLERYPEVRDFIKKRAGEYTNLEVRYVRGMPPRLALTYLQDDSGSGRRHDDDDDDDGDDSMDIAAWKIADIAAFLDTKLQRN